MYEYALIRGIFKMRVKAYILRIRKSTGIQVKLTNFSSSAIMKRNETERDSSRFD